MDVSGGMVLRRYFRETCPRSALRLMSSEEWDSCREMRWAAISEVARRKRSCSGAVRSKEFLGVFVGFRPKEVEVVVGVVATMVDRFEWGSLGNWRYSIERAVVLADAEMRCCYNVVYLWGRIDGRKPVYNN